jgi:hypothetical protein
MHVLTDGVLDANRVVVGIVLCVFSIVTVVGLLVRLWGIHGSHSSSRGRESSRGEVKNKGDQ